MAESAPKRDPTSEDRSGAADWGIQRKVVDLHAQIRKGAGRAGSSASCMYNVREAKSQNGGLLVEEIASDSVPSV
jgi:hypothetical protein